MSRASKGRRLRMMGQSALASLPQLRAGRDGLTEAGADAVIARVEKLGALAREKQVSVSALAPRALKEDVKRLMNSPWGPSKMLSPDAPEHVKAWAEAQTQRQLAGERLGERLKGPGSHLPQPRRLQDLTDEEMWDLGAEYAVPEREAMLQCLSAMIEHAQRSPDVPDHSTPTLIRLYTGLKQVQNGRRFWLFEPVAPEGSGSGQELDPVAAVLRVQICAAVSALILAKEKKQKALEIAAEKIAACPPAYFDMPSDKKIEGKQISNWRDCLAAKDDKADAYRHLIPSPWEPTTTTAQAVYAELMSEVLATRRAGGDLRALAERLFMSAIERRGPSHK